MNITLDDRLNRDTYRLGEFDDSLLLLSKNAFFPWFILVPETDKTEYHQLNNEQQTRIQQHINAIARYIETHFATDKINIATIGNLVPQLHIHIIGRNQNDPCWPGVVWGTQHFKAYSAEDVATIKNQLNNALKEVVISEVSQP
jgi:diadenosine tetraphosphate (Ap4A) HIT family hydrolase